MENVATRNESRPQVLVLGNGILRAFEGAAGSCQDLENLIYDAANVNNSSRVRGRTIPFPMRVAASLAGSKDRHAALKKAIEQVKKAPSKGCPATKELLCNTEIVAESFFNKLLNAGFSDIITTNYSYEIEKVLCGKCPKTGNETGNFYRDFIGPKNFSIVEHKFKIWKYHRSKDETTRIWHVHGEYLRPNSIIFEYSDYCSFLARVRDYPQPKQEELVNNPERPTPWVQSFFNGDVYILGFGAAFGESVFWWLMERKKFREWPAGKVYFYEPTFTDASMKEEQEDRRAMFRAFGAECRDLGVRRSKDSDFKSFYKKASKDICRELKDRKAIDAE